MQLLFISIYKFLYQKFSDKYMTTIGVKVDKKVIDIDDKTMTMLIWDIAGEVSQDKVPGSYFLGASGIIYVFDLSREGTFENIESDFKRALEMGAIEFEPLTEKPWGQKVGYVRDNNGFLIEICTPIKME